MFRSRLGRHGRQHVSSPDPSETVPNPTPKSPRDADPHSPGLFLGSGRSIASAGPGGAVLCYLVVGTIIASINSCLGEMTALMPVNSPMMEFPRRFLDRGVGFAVGWIYW